MAIEGSEAPGPQTPFPPFLEGFVSYLASRSLDWANWRIWVSSNSQDFLTGNYGIEVEGNKGKKSELWGVFGKEKPSPFFLTNQLLKKGSQAKGNEANQNKDTFRMEKNSKGEFKKNF